MSERCMLYDLHVAVAYKERFACACCTQYIYIYTHTIYTVSLTSSSLILDDPDQAGAQKFCCWWAEGPCPAWQLTFDASHAPKDSLNVVCQCCIWYATIYYITMVILRMLDGLPRSSGSSWGRHFWHMEAQAPGPASPPTFDASHAPEDSLKWACQCCM